MQWCDGGLQSVKHKTKLQDFAWFSLNSPDYHDQYVTKFNFLILYAPQQTHESAMNTYHGQPAVCEKCYVHDYF